VKLSEVLDREFARVAKSEGISMDELVKEVALLTECSTRQLYNYRSGKWGLPSDFIPVLCKRFRSLTLLHALEDECGQTPVDVPEAFDLTRLVSQTVRDDMRHYEGFLAAFEDGVIDEREMKRLCESSERVIQNVRQFLAIARTDFERRQTLKRR
jgi:hypothetical protein